MKQKDIPQLAWIPWTLYAMALLCAGYLFFFAGGCSFLGIVVAASVMIRVGFRLLDLLDKKNHRAAKKLRLSARIVLLAVNIAVCATLIPILRGPTDVKMRSDYVIVLGAGVRGTEPSEILADRIEMAAQYLKKNPDAICVATGGKGNDENISEAQCIYDHLTAMGIDGSRIWLEEQATSTIENFRYSIALIEEKTGAVPKSVTVLSNEFHLYRASRMAGDCGLEADFIAAPTSDGLIRISYTLREVFALWKYLIMGG